MANLLQDLPPAGPEEVFIELLAHPCARIEQIVSTGQATPEDAPYSLRPGDHVFIPAGRRHRVTWTARDDGTVWLAVHLAG